MFSPTLTAADIAPPIATSPVAHLSVPETIVLQARAYATPEKALLQVARCESQFDPRAYNPKDSDGLPAYGLFQFKKQTFLKYAVRIGIKTPDIWNPTQQSQVAAYMFSNRLQNQWGCYHK